MSVRPLALMSLSAAIFALPTVADASVWLADLEVTEITGERIQEEVKTSCRKYHYEETESGYWHRVCAEFNTDFRDTYENRYTVTLTNRVDDDARSPEARFFLPLGSELVSVDHADCAAGPTIADQTGVVECFFDDMSPRESITFTVVTTAPELHPYTSARGMDDSTATVMVFSLSPDWDMSNNTASASAD